MLLALLVLLVPPTLAAIPWPPARCSAQPLAGSTPPRPPWWVQEHALPALLSGDLETLARQQSANARQEEGTHAQQAQQAQQAGALAEAEASCSTGTVGHSDTLSGGKYVQATASTRCVRVWVGGGGGV